LTISLNVFTTNGATVLWTLGRVTVTLEGVVIAALMGIRLIFLIIGSSLLTLTTSPIVLTDGIEALLKPLQKIKVPSHEIAMMMTIALRFIPILLEETDKIMKAQMARGADFDTGGLIKKAKSLIPLLVPLFISSFRRADDLALAMEARCYNGGEGRTRMNIIIYSKRDYLAYMYTFIYIAILIVIKLFVTG
jgi:energy-coupling factor transport system permease protein